MAFVVQSLTGSATTAVSSLAAMSMTPYTAEWLDLSSESSYRQPTRLPRRITPPRSGAVSFSDPSSERLFTFAGYAEVPSSGDGGGSPLDRFVLNDLFEFVPYDEGEEAAPWGWMRVDQETAPGPRLATTASTIGGKAAVMGGWDPQTTGSGGVILEDVALLDLDTLEWTLDGAPPLPDGPTSRHVSATVRTADGKSVICLHNHRCTDHVLLLSQEEGGDVSWEKQAVSGDVPSSRGLHCASAIDGGIERGVVIFGGAAQDQAMSNEAFFLDANIWRWTKLDCGDKVPPPRAGASMCQLDERTVILFGGATPGSGGLVGLNDLWILQIDPNKGKGTWTCLMEHGSSDANVRVKPPGRNAATLSLVDTLSLPKSCGIGRDEKAYLLQGGWDPFRVTFNDMFVLKVKSC